MKKRLTVIAYAALNLGLSIAAATALYRWVTDGDKVTCVANAFAFGCSTTLGRLLTVLGAVVVVVGAALWSHFRDR
jgi:hypothetical protein